MFISGWLHQTMVITTTSTRKSIYETIWNPLRKCWLHELPRVIHMITGNIITVRVGVQIHRMPLNWKVYQLYRFFTVQCVQAAGQVCIAPQKKTFNSGEIYTFIADSPTGPWRNKQLIFKTYEQDTPHLFTYNAMAHPQFEKDGMILVSYNVNTEVFAEQFSDVSTYRPRFFWIMIDKIMN